MEQLSMPGEMQSVQTEALLCSEEGPRYYIYF